MKPNRHVDAVMPCWGNLDYTKLAVESFLTRVDPEATPYHLILVDNGSEDGTDAYFKDVRARHPDRVKLVSNAKNLGWVEAVNQGVETLCPEAAYFLAVNNDVLFTQDDWLGTLVRAIEDKPWLAGAGPTSNAVMGRQNVIHNNPKSKGEETPFVIGFCMLVKRELVDRLVGRDGFFMDPLYNPGGFDEIDVALRLQDDGYRWWVDRSVYVHHFCSKSLRKITNDLDAFHREKVALAVRKFGEERVRRIMSPTVERVLIGIPTYGQIHHKFLLTLVSLEKPEGVGVDTVPRSLPDVARNKLAEEALAFGYDYVFFLDDDMIFNEADLLMRLLETMRKDPTIDVLSPIAYMRSAPYHPCVFRKSADPPYYLLVHEPGKGLLDVDATTCAATLVRMSVFRRLEAALGHRRYFDWVQVGNERMGEDVSFCHRVKELLKGRVVVDTDRSVYHISDNLLVGRETYEKYHTQAVVREVLKFTG